MPRDATPYRSNARPKRAGQGDDHTLAKDAIVVVLILATVVLALNGAPILRYVTTLLTGFSAV